MVLHVHGRSDAQHGKCTSRRVVALLVLLTQTLASHTSAACCLSGANDRWCVGTVDRSGWPNRTWAGDLPFARGVLLSSSRPRAKSSQFSLPSMIVVEISFLTIFTAASGCPLVLGLYGEVTRCSTPQRARKRRRVEEVNCSYNNRYTSICKNRT